MSKGSCLSFTKMSRHLKRLSKAWFVLAVLAGLLILAVVFLQSPERNMASTTLIFSFDGIDAGLDPFGNRFDPEDIKADAYLRAAAEQVGMETDTKTIERLSGAISIRGYVPESAIDQAVAYTKIVTGEGSETVAVSTDLNNSSFTPTQYTVSLNTKSAGCSASRGRQLLDALVEAYSAAFHEMYGYNRSIGDAVQAIDYNDYDYTEAIDVLDGRLVSLRSYISQLAGEDYTRFRAESTGYTFADLVAAIDTIRSEDISWVSSYIVSNNITKDRDELIDYYQYQIEEAQRAQTAELERLSALRAMAEGYTKTKTVILGIDSGSRGDSGGYEFTQPSTFYDSLSADTVKSRTSIREIQERINLYAARSERLRYEASTGSVALVEERLANMDAKIKALISNTEQTVTEYAETVRLKRAIQVVGGSSRSGLSLGTLIRRAFGTALAAEALLLGLFVLFAALLSVDRKSKKEALMLADGAMQREEENGRR